MIGGLVFLSPADAMQWQIIDPSTSQRFQNHVSYNVTTQFLRCRRRLGEEQHRHALPTKIEPDWYGFCRLLVHAIVCPFGVAPGRMLDLKHPKEALLTIYNVSYARLGNCAPAVSSNKNRTPPRNFHSRTRG